MRTVTSELPRRTPSAYMCVFTFRNACGGEEPTRPPAAAPPLLRLRRQPVLLRSDGGDDGADAGNGEHAQAGQ